MQQKLRLIGSDTISHSSAYYYPLLSKALLNSNTIKQAFFSDN